jgi:hypothetical protein
MASRADRELATVRLALADDRRDRVVAVSEDVAEEKDGALDAAEPFEHPPLRGRGGVPPAAKG